MQDAAASQADQAKWARWRAVAELYHACFTGLILTVVTRRGAPAAEEFVFRVFRRQQEERFLAGLDKLGLSRLPPAVAAAQYHYLSNWIGGVHVEYMYESDRKAWIRYPAAALDLAGHGDLRDSDGSVSRAMLRGWHANNGVALKNLRLGFVCTKQGGGRAGWSRGLLLRIRSRSCARRAAGVRAASRGAAVRSGARAGAARRRLAEAAAGEGLSQLRPGIRAHRGAGAGAAAWTRGGWSSAAPDGEADRHAVLSLRRAWRLPPPIRRSMRQASPRFCPRSLRPRTIAATVVEAGRRLHHHPAGLAA